MAIDGTLTPPGVLSARGGSQKWTLDTLGNWDAWAVDLANTFGPTAANGAADSTSFSTNETQTRGHIDDQDRQPIQPLHLPHRPHRRRKQTLPKPHNLRPIMQHHPAHKLLPRRLPQRSQPAKVA